MWTELNRFALMIISRVQVQREEGQALVEYTLILALISVVAIVALTTIGTDVKTQLEKVVTSLAGA
jgi:pilus assembly protein Flp/PilA